MDDSKVQVETNAAIWLVHCGGRPTQTTPYASSADASRAAKRLAAQWPGHAVTVFKSGETYIAARPPRPAGPAAPPGTSHF